MSARARRCDVDDDDASSRHSLARAPPMRVAASTLTARARHRATTITATRSRLPSSRRRATTTTANGKAAQLAPLDQRVDLRVGLVISAKRHEEAEKLVRERDGDAREMDSNSTTREEDERDERGAMERCE